jgi:hypothetical protein
MKINGFYLFLIIFIISMLVAMIFPSLRYIRYFLPLLPVMMFSEYKRKLAVDRSIINYFLTFLIFYLLVIGYLLIVNLINWDISQRFFPNAVFILAPLTFVIFILPFFNPDKIGLYVKSMFFMSVLIYLSEVGFNITDVVSTIKSIATAHMPSEVATESELGFVFGFFVLYFFLQKSSKLYLIMSLLFFIISFKRIVIAGVLISLMAYLILKIFRIDVKRHKVKLTLIALAVNLTIIYGAQLLVSGTFDQHVLEYTGLSSDAFLLGRKTFYTEVFEKFGSYNLAGLGLGKVDDALFSQLGYPMNLHSELIKNYLEFGLIMFLIWMALLIYKNLFSNKAIVFLIYFNLLIVTDNIFIYFHGMF